MSAKLTGAQYKAFIRADWGSPSAYWDDVCMRINGEDVDEFDADENNISNHDCIEILSGDVFIQDSGGEYSKAGCDAVAFAKRWVDSLSTIDFLIKIPKEDVEAFKLLVENNFPQVEILQGGS